MLSVQIDRAQYQRLKHALGEKKRLLGKEIAIAVNITAKAVKREISKTIRQELIVPKRAVDETISVQSKANREKFQAIVRTKKVSRIRLKEFRAYQTRKGVSYRISKTTGRKVAPGAFVVQKYDGNVYRRVSGARGPLQALHGPSPWGVLAAGERTKIVKQIGEQELKKQIQRRIRFHVLKAEGRI